MVIGKKASVITASIAAPIKGWNARDPIAQMAPLYAVKLINLFPTPSEVVVRKGNSVWASGVRFGVSNPVESLLVYAGANNDQFFAAIIDSIYDVTIPGAAPDPPAVGSLSNARFQYINFATSGGEFMLAVNGEDKLQGYDGTSWWVDGDGTHNITGVDTVNCVQINAFKNRVWLIENHSLNAWYLPTGSIAGAATAFPLQGIATLGGYIVAMATWTIDAGYGVDDLAVFITNKGEVIVYKGTDPSSASTWAEVGVWQLGAPVGRRCFCKFAGDLLLLCQDGLVAMSGYLQSSRTNPKVALSDTIQNAVSEAVGLYGSNFGWQICYFPKANMLILNVPISEATGQKQFVMNTITKAWCTFENWNAGCWEIYKDDLYFGSYYDTIFFGNAGTVRKAWDGFSDAGNAQAADNINFRGKQAFNYFGMHGINKRFTMMRPIISSNGSPAILANINVDFKDDVVNTQIPIIPNSYAVWDLSSTVWDDASWGGDKRTLLQWQSVTGIGGCAAPVLIGASSGIDSSWISTDFTMEKGGVL